MNRRSLAREATGTIKAAEYVIKYVALFAVYTLMAVSLFALAGY